MEEEKNFKIKKSVAFIGGGVSILVLIVLSILLFSNNKKVNQLKFETSCVQSEMSYKDSIQIKSLYIIENRLKRIAKSISSIDEINETIYDIDNILIAYKSRSLYASMIRLNEFKRDYKFIIEFSMDEINNICNGKTSDEDIEKNYSAMIKSKIEKENEENKTKL